MNVLAQKQLPNSCIYITQFIIPCSSNYILPSNLRGIYVCTNIRNQHTKKIAFSRLSFFSFLFLQVLTHQSLTQSFHIVSFPSPLPLLHLPSPTARLFASVSSNHFTTHQFAYPKRNKKPAPCLTAFLSRFPIEFGQKNCFNGFLFSRFNYQYTDLSRIKFLEILHLWTLHYVYVDSWQWSLMWMWTQRSQRACLVNAGLLLNTYFGIIYKMKQ